jgi:hypothetical protein
MDVAHSSLRAVSLQPRVAGNVAVALRKNVEKDRSSLIDKTATLTALVTVLRSQD